MWYVLRAEPGAAIACGLRERITPARLREASLSGEIERLLNWLPVAPGDMIFTPPGTIHAIGAGHRAVRDPAAVGYHLPAL